MSIAISTSTTGVGFDKVVAKTREVLKDNGFGVLTEIDVQATLKEKLGESMERYLILGSCNPQLAHRALNADKQVGLLLPCNVVVREDAQNPATVHIEAMDPQVMVQVVAEPALTPVAEQATRLLREAIDTLAKELR
ncbi:DUF302 domain-containing protein [Mycobacterium heckeshornense]|uniref:ABC transporter n=1 Tax=Mycobacterium heckeshornense TaxID=110505 RepID=A0A2G8BH93_9MYCO|nr:DUF302 domain-containing protein [Mycobacterium heckeshornense]KMV23427.1 ABC transporter [Mycobacterium heckeshornense]MCV7032755.1 DUF302 domain-containing protein [Mycobacterium heckeshornense]PIJ37104.1 DUF302 domain-containing protein [Mycobacterium heckeshornense]BCO35392.1 ABC transporter [Mycobacterium heckeshornense]